MSSITVSIYFVKAILRNIAHHERDRLLIKNDISPKLLDQANARVAARDYANLLRDGTFYLQDEGLGYYSAPIPLGSWETACQLAIGADNLGEALQRFTRFFRFSSWGPMPRLSHNPTSATLSIDRTFPPETPPYLFEAFLFFTHRFTTWLIAEQIPVTQLDWTFAEHSHASEYRGMFNRCPVNYQQHRSQLSFDRHYLDKPLKQDNKSLKDFMKHPNYSMVVQVFNHRSWQYRVSTLLSKQISQNPSLEDIAGSLHTHPQTLRRNLKREGFEYREIKNRVRCEAAIYLLRTSGKSVEETAFSVGFSEASNFVRSFKSWTGVTPLTYRKSGHEG